MILTYIQSIEDINKREIVENIYNAYYPKMLACAQKILNNPDDALDAVQDAFLNITRTYEKFQNCESDECAALTYIYTRNAAIHIYKKNKRRNKVIILQENLDNLHNFKNPEIDLRDLLMNQEALKEVSAVIDTLNQEYRDIILLKYFYNMSSKDIALILHIKPKAVNQKTYKAKLMIYKKLGGNMND